MNVGKDNRSQNQLNMNVMQGIIAHKVLWHRSNVQLEHIEKIKVDRIDRTANFAMQASTAFKEALSDPKNYASPGSIANKVKTMPSQTSVR